MTPEENLCNPWWKARHSVWLIPSVVGIGLVTWVGFLFIGLRVKRKLWVFFGIGYLVALVALTTLISAYPVGGTKGNPENPENSWTGGVMLAFWVIGIVHSALTNKAWLRRRAYFRADRAIAKASALRAAQEARATEIASSLPPALAHAQAPDPVGSGAAKHGVPTGEPVDVNSAGASALVTAGLTVEEADAIVLARHRGGDYAQVTDLIARAGIAPHRFALVRSNLVVAQARSDRSDTPTAGRRLDL